MPYFHPFTRRRENNVKNPMAIIAALAAGFIGILKVPHLTPWELKKDQWGRGKRKVGHSEKIARTPGYNKAMLRCQTRSQQPGWAKGE